MFQKVAIDNDFLQHLAGTHGDAEAVRDMIRRFFQDLEYEPLLHELVYRHEVILKSHPVIERLLAEKDVRIAPLFPATEPDAEEPILPSDAEKVWYEYLVEEIYKNFMGESYPCDVCSGWKAGKSLGEVHCVVMCFSMNLPCLLSDDKGAKALRNIADSMLGKKVSIFSRQDCQTCLQGKLHNLKRGELRRLCHDSH